MTTTKVRRGRIRKSRMTRKMRMRRMEEEEGDDEDEEENGQWRSSLARFWESERMSGNDRRMRARRREEDEAEEVRQQQHMFFPRKLTNLEVVEFGEARAESHSPKK